jgi:hypothetical protein
LAARGHGTLLNENHFRQALRGTVACSKAY